MITVFNHFWSKKPKFVEVEYVLDAIRKGSIKEKIEQIRDATDENERKRLKETLPCILFSGEFSERADSKILKHSGIICLDFDKFKTREELEAYKEELKADPYVYVIFDSPSGAGIKVLVKTTNDTDNHRGHFRALRDYFNNPNFDSTCINESRVCFMSYDPDIHINKDSEIFTAIQEQKEHKPIEATENDKTISGLFTWWNNRHGFVEGQRNRNIFILAMAMNEFGVPEIDALNFLSQFERQDFTGNEIRNCVRSAYKKTHLHNTKAFSDKSISEYESTHEPLKEVRFDVSDVFKKAYVDVRKPLIRQPVAVSIGEYSYKGNMYPNPFGTYGNFSALVGASKAKKSFAKSMIVASYLGGDSHKYCMNMTGHKDREMFVLDIDTEQSTFDAQRAFKRVMDMYGTEYHEYYKPFALRPYTPKERLEFIEWLVYESDYRDNIGLLSIDGLVDLAYDFNDLKESSALIQKVMTWTDDKQFHLTTVIHSNPGTDKASGHLGTTILKKAETTCLVSKQDDGVSVMKFPYTRGMGIDDFNYAVNDNGIPYIISGLDITKREMKDVIPIEEDDPF